MSWKRGSHIIPESVTEVRVHQHLIFIHFGLLEQHHMPLGLSAFRCGADGRSRVQDNWPNIHMVKSAFQKIIPYLIPIKSRLAVRRS